MSQPDDGWSAEMQSFVTSAAERAARVASIAYQVAAGDYEVPAAEVADAVVAFFSRTLESPPPSNPS